MRFKHGWTPPRNHLPKDSIEHCISTTRMALDLGINHIETAHGYMKSELLFGHALKELGVPRKQFKMMTKGAPMSGDETRRLVEEQLEALGLDHVDFYGWHGINNKELLKIAVEKNGPVETLHRLKDEGLIRHVGFSTHAHLTQYWMLCKLACLVLSTFIIIIFFNATFQLCNWQKKWIWVFL